MFTSIAVLSKHFKRPPTLLILLVLLALELAPLPLTTLRLNPSKALLKLAHDTSISAVHDAGQVPEQMMERQMFHGKRITRGMLARRPKPALKRIRNNRFVRCLEQDCGLDSERKLAAWKKLKVDALLVLRRDVKLFERAQAIDWLIEKHSDSNLSIFVPRKSAIEEKLVKDKLVNLQKEDPRRAPHLGPHLHPVL